MRKSITVKELYNKFGKRYNSNIDTIKRKPFCNDLMNNDTRIRIRDTLDTSYKLLLCIDYDPNKIIDTGILTTPEEAVSGNYIDHADTIKDIIVANNKAGTAHSFEYIASGKRINRDNRTVMIIGLSSSGGTGHDTNIYQVTRNTAVNWNFILRLRGNYSGKSLQSALDAFNSGNIPSYMQPMVSMYSYSQSAYKEITSWNNFMATTPWNTNISTLKWLRCLDISYITDISSLAKNTTLITTDEGLEVFANHPLIDMEAMFYNCSALHSISHMNDYILLFDGSNDATKSMFSVCPNLNYLELIGWNISTNVPYLSMFTPSGGVGKDFMRVPNKTCTIIVDGTMKDVMMNFGGSDDPNDTNVTTEDIIYRLLSNATLVNGIYTIIYEVPSE